MAKLKGELQADNGDVLYPHTSSDVVFMLDGKTVEQQMNVLSTSINGWRIYNSIAELGLIESSTILQIIEAMPTKSIAILDSYHDINDAPDRYGLVTIKKINSARVECELIVTSGNNKGMKYTGTYHSTSGFAGWKPVATTEKMDISFPYASGYTARSGWISRVTKTQDNIVIIEAGLNKTDGTAFPTTETFIGNLPVGYRPIENLLVQSSATFFGGADSKFVGIVNVKSSGSVYIDTMGKNAIGCGFVFQFNGGA